MEQSLPIDAASRTQRYARVGLVLVVALAAFVAYRQGWFAQVADPRRFTRTVLDMGIWGYAAFLLTYTLLQPFGVPGTVFIVAAPLIWPWPVAFALSLIGTMGASVVGFSFARFVARDWVSARIPERFRKYEDALARDGFRTVVLLRLIFWMPQLLHAFLGVSKVRFWTHFWGSVLGYIPPLFVVSYFGARIFDADGNFSPDGWPVLGGMLAASVTLVLALHLLRRRRAARA